jgi:hypothetical protein
MPTTRIFRGDAPPQAQVTKITPATVDVGDKFTLTCNGKSVSYTALAATVADVVAGLVAAVTASTIPEFAEMLASAAADNSYLTLTAVTAGVPFTVTTSTTNTTAGQIAVVETTKGVAAVNEVHKITLTGNYSGGTFTITYDFGGGAETTAAIAYNATAAAVQTALEGLTTPVPGDVAVTGGPGPNSPWFVTWKGAFAGINVNLGTINGASLTGNGTVTIATTTDGNGRSDEIQLLDCSVPPQAAGGQANFTLTLDGQTTSTLHTQMTAAQIQTALQALPNIGSGNALVYGATPTSSIPVEYAIRFTGTLAGTSVSTLVVGGWSDPNAMPTVTSLQEGGLTTSDDFQFIDMGPVNNFGITYNGKTYVGTTANFVGSLAAARLQAGLAALSTIGANNVLVYGPSYVPPSGSVNVVKGFLVRFVGALANTRASLLSVVSGDGSATVTRINVGLANTNEVQTVTVFGTGGTFTLTLGAQTTSAIAWNAAAATVETRIETDLNNTVTNVTVTGAGTLASPYVVTLVTPANTNIAQMTGSGASLTGGGGAITEQTNFVAAVNEVQTVTEAAGINGGTFTLAFNGAVTGPQAWNISAATLQTNLRALGTIGGANVNVSGSAGGPYTITFVGTLAATDVPMLVGDGSLLTGATGTQSLAASTTTFSSGPNHYNDPINWTGGRIPDSADNIVFEEGSTDCLYGLQQAATFTADAASDTITFTSSADFLTDQIVYLTNAGGGLPAGLAAATPYYLISVNRDAGTCQLAATSGGAAINITSAGTGTHTLAVRANSLEFNSKYTGAIGLSKLNAAGYYEYRPLYLHIGLLSSGPKTVTVGTGQGSGAGKLQLDTDVDQASVKIIQTGGSIESGIPALLWKGTHASNTFNLIDGSAGVAIYAGESAVIAPLTQRSGSLELGSGATITGVDKTGGTLLSNGATINGVCVL